MGGDRAGWYSWDRLDHGGKPSADKIVPEWQNLAEGQRLELLSRGEATSFMAACATAAVRNFFNSVRTRTQPVEDATFGFRAAGAALLSNVSLQRESVVHWNPETMKLS